MKTEILRHVGHGDEIFDNFPHLKSEQIADCVIFALSAPPGTQVKIIFFFIYLSLIIIMKCYLYFCPYF